MTTCSTTNGLRQAIQAGNLFIALCAGDEINIVCRRLSAATEFLIALDYVFRPLPSPPYEAEKVEGHYFILPVSDDAMKASQLMVLRDHGVPFSEGKEWSPCEVFEYLRDDLGLAEGGYWAIGWSKPDNFRVSWRGLDCRRPPR